MVSILLWTVGILVGYCLVCWIVGFSMYFLGKIHPEVRLQSTVYAPIMPLAVSIVYIDSLLGGVKRLIQVRRMRGYSNWISEQLIAKGIKVFGNFDMQPLYKLILDRESYDLHGQYGYNAPSDHCKVVSKLEPSQIAAYQDVYAAAIKRFNWLTPVQICGSALPAEPLNSEWASRVGIAEYFDVEFFAPCIECGKKEPLQKLVWGDKTSHMKLHGAGWARNYCLLDGTTKNVQGRLCDVCENNLFASM